MNPEPGEALPRAELTPSAASPERWRGAEHAPLTELVTASCAACGKTWLVHQDMSGFRIRCRCRELLMVPRLLGVAEPAPARSIIPARRGLGSWTTRRRPISADQDVPEISVAQRARGVNRAWIQLILILAALIGPWAVAFFHYAGPAALGWWPFASLASGVLITVVGMFWPRTAFAGLARPAAVDLVLGVAIGLGLGLLAVLYSRSLGGADPLQSIRASLGLPVALFTISLCPAIFEEIAFRGLLQGTLTEIWGNYLAWTMTACIFALCHGVGTGFPFHIGLGLLLGWMRIRSGSLYPGMAMHMVYNGIIVVVGNT